jgi:signal transduction histidine kinase/PAS domain-containing protein
MAPMSRRPVADDARRLKVQQVASRVLLEAASLDEAMAEILQVLATELGWSLAIYWAAVPDPRSGRAALCCRAIWAEEAIVRSAVVEASRAAVLAPSEEPPGAALAGRESIWIERLTGQEPSARLRLAVAAGLHAVAAFPVRQREAVPAVIELFAREPSPIDEGVLQLMTAVGHQICLVLHRMEAQSHALEALDRAREEVETILRALPDGITVRDGAGRLVYANEAIARAVGLPNLRASPAELLGRFQLWDENGRPLSPDEISRAGPAAPGEERILRYRPIGQEGGDRWVSLKAAAVDPARAGDQRIVIVMRDVTNERRDREWQRFLGDASTALASSMDLPTALEELAALAARTVADRCAVVLRKRSGEPRLMAYAGAVGADTSDRDAAVERGRKDCLKAAQLAMTGRQPILENDAGISAMAVPLELRGESVGAIVLAGLGEGRRYGPSDLGAAQELARRASIAIDNVRLLAEAQESVRAREDLLAIVSHDLRNPLGVVLASSALLLKSSLPPDAPGKEGRARRQVEAIERAANRMNRLIRDLLDFAAIQAGRLSVSSHPREVGALLREVQEALEPLAAAKSIRLVASPVEAPDLRISCDHDRVIQLFSNVVGNAVKFTPEGGTVALRAEPDGPMVRFAVADDGPGISTEELPYVFDRYYQSRRRNRDGIGLGLSIARGIVEAHGGRIWVESPTGPPQTDGNAAAKPEATMPEAAKPEAAMPEAAKPEATMPEAAKPEAANLERGGGPNGLAHNGPTAGPNGLANVQAGKAEKAEGPDRFGGTTFFFTLPAPQQ